MSSRGVISVVSRVLAWASCSGNWVNGVKVGQGAFVSGRDESQLVGTWVAGAITRGKWMFADGTTWHGAFKKNRPIGPGVFYFPNGTQQEVRLRALCCPSPRVLSLRPCWRPVASVALWCCAVRGCTSSFAAVSVDAVAVVLTRRGRCACSGSVRGGG
jgi:hypothetical protein